MQALKRPRPFAVLAAAALGFAAGCAPLGERRAPEPAATAPAQFGAAPARITQVHPEYGFVVIDFGSRLMPPVGTRLNVYREERRVGAVRITEPVRTRFATADILEGELRVGDLAR